jgi:hypothetical protein
VYAVLLASCCMFLNCEFYQVHVQMANRIALWCTWAYITAHVAIMCRSYATREDNTSMISSSVSNGTARFTTPRLAVKRYATHSTITYHNESHLDTAGLHLTCMNAQNLECISQHKIQMHVSCMLYTELSVSASHFTYHTMNIHVNHQAVTIDKGGKQTQ